MKENIEQFLARGGRIRAYHYKQQLLEKQTLQERKLARELTNQDIIFKPQFIYHFKESFCIMDFYLPESRLCVEIDGYHHQYDPKQKQYDTRRDRTLQKVGVKTLRFPNRLIDQRANGIAYLIKKIAIKRFVTGEDQGKELKERPVITLIRKAEKSSESEKDKSLTNAHQWRSDLPVSGNKTRGNGQNRAY